MRAGAESAMHGMVKDKDRTTDLIIAVAGQELGGAAAMMTEETFAEQENFCF